MTEMPADSSDLCTEPTPMIACFTVRSRTILGFSLLSDTISPAASTLTLMQAGLQESLADILKKT